MSVIICYLNTPFSREKIIIVFQAFEHVWNYPISEDLHPYGARMGGAKHLL